MFLIWKSAPVEHPHKKLDELTMKTNRKKSFVYTLTMFVVIMIFWNIDRTAKEAVCSASPWLRYQPIESERVREWAHKEK